LQVKAYIISQTPEEEERVAKIINKDPASQNVFSILGNPCEDFILLNTTSFNELPLEPQEHLKKGMGNHLRRFGQSLLIAANCYFASDGKNEEALKIIEEGLGLMEQKLQKVLAIPQL